MRHRDDLSDDDILRAMQRWGNGAATYVLRNILSKSRPDLTTASVRDRLIRMEREGKVERVPSSYKVMICWRPKVAA